MFEKDAEEILDKHCDCELHSECLEGIRIRCSDFEEKKKLLIEGIEFGYNKANKWHYVKDGDLPEVDNKIVSCICGDGYIDGKRHYILKLLTRKEFPLFQPVYAWKEIVLPELPKEIKENEEWYVILNMNCKYEICRMCPKSGLFKGSYEECEKWIAQRESE